MDILPSSSDLFAFSLTITKGDPPLTCNNRKTTGKENSHMKNSTWNKEGKRKFRNFATICSVEGIKDMRTVKMEVLKHCYLDAEQRQTSCLRASNTGMFHRKLQTMFSLQFILILFLLILSFVDHGLAQGESSTVGKLLLNFLQLYQF